MSLYLKPGVSFAVRIFSSKKEKKFKSKTKMSTPVTNSLDMLLGSEHPDITYLKKDSIADVLSKALTETYRNQPNDPVAFFA